MFLETRNATGINGTVGVIYALLIGLLMAQYTITGFDASAHVAEETRDAARSAPRGIVMSPPPGARPRRATTARKQVATIRSLARRTLKFVWVFGSCDLVLRWARNFSALNRSDSAQR